MSEDKTTYVVLKCCSRCKGTRALSEFHRSGSTADGLMGMCKACKSEDNRAFRERRKIRAAGVSHGTATETGNV